VEDLKQVVGKQPFWKTFEVPTTGEFEPNEVLCAARGIRGAVTPADLRSVLERIRGTKRTATPELDRLSTGSEDVLAGVADEKPAEQGHKLAIWLRSQLGLGTKPLLVADILKSLRVTARAFSLAASHIDAISFWGKRHGPAVLVNKLGTHAQTRPGANATLAHELCHLIADRNNALPFGEVFTRASLPVESRARAFAAELLVPSTVAVDAFAQNRNPARVLKRLCRKFNASAEVVAWQVRNSGTPLDKTTRAFLRGKVSRPEAF
jgi:Zn-dependent peptidase ImmA (M78 family)